MADTLTRTPAGLPAAVSSVIPQGVGAPPPPGLDSKKGKLMCIKVRLLDDTVGVFHLGHKALGRALFDEVCRHLNLLESDYFGLEFFDCYGNRCWLDYEKPILRQIQASRSDARFFFVVKFYTPSPEELEEEYTRYLFVLQVRRDLATGQLPCSDNTAALLASYAVQGECGDYSAEDYHDHSYLSAAKFVPRQDAEFEKKVMERHKEHVGMSPAEADIDMLLTARRCEMYGVKLHHAKDHEGTALFISCVHCGIKVFHHQTLVCVNVFSWAKMRKLSFKKKRFLIKLHPDSYAYYKDMVEFFFETRDECKMFWKKCIEHHAFFRCAETTPTPGSIASTPGMGLGHHHNAGLITAGAIGSRTPRTKQRLFSKGSSFRYCGRTQKQLIDYIRNHHKRRETFQRPLLRSTLIVPPGGRIPVALPVASPDIRDSTRSLPAGGHLRQPDVVPNSRQNHVDSHVPGLALPQPQQDHDEDLDVQPGAPKLPPCSIPSPASTFTPSQQTSPRHAHSDADVPTAANGHARSVSSPDSTPSHRLTLLRAMHLQSSVESATSTEGQVTLLDSTRSIGRVAASSMSSFGNSSIATGVSMRLPLSIAPNSEFDDSVNTSLPQDKSCVSTPALQNFSALVSPTAESIHNGLSKTSLLTSSMSTSNCDLSFCLAKELLHTERTYLSDLNLITSLFKNTVSTCVSLQVTDQLYVQQQLQPLFDSLQTLEDAQQQVLAQLEERVSLWETPSSPTGSPLQPHRVGDIMLAAVHSILQIYQSYAGRLTGLVTQLHEMRRECPAFVEIINLFDSDKRAYVPIEHLMLRPVHRLLCYQRVLMLLISHYSERGGAQPDLADCRTALDRLAISNQLARSATEHLENLTKLYEIERNLTSIENLVQPNRTFVLEGTLHRHNRRGSALRMFFLLSDCLLYAARTQTPSQFRLNTTIPLRGLILIDGDQHNMSDGAAHCFTLYGGNRSLVVSASTAEYKALWMQYISEAVIGAKENTADIPLVGGVKACSSTDDMTARSDVNDTPRHAESMCSTPRTSGESTHVCWHRQTALGWPQWQLGLRTNHSGYLLRKFRNSSGWQMLWVVFANLSLFFYKSHHESSPLASLPLLAYSVSAEDQTHLSSRNVFKLHFKQHVYFFKSDSDYAYLRWLECLSVACVPSSSTPETEVLPPPPADLLTP